ncbi:MAG: PAS domain S-box protein, partial [bacterium]|nr:PAS domain S-box protein [bacterium]
MNTGKENPQTDERQSKNDTSRLEKLVGKPTAAPKNEIATRRRAENALRESEERYRTLVENQGEGIGIVDRDERFTFANLAAEKIFGVPPDSLVGRNLKEFTTPEAFASILEQTNVRRQGEISTYDVEIVRQDGEKRVLIVTASPQYDENQEVSATFGIFRDITERK